MISAEDRAALAALNRHNDADSAAFQEAVTGAFKPTGKPVPMDPVSAAITSADLENLFAHHPPTGDQVERYEQLRACGLEFAKLIVQLTPRSLQQTLAIRTVKNALMLANEAIAANE
jgi:hypothetical protein